MKPSHFCALFIALAALSAPQTARAQPADMQPRPAQSAIKANAKIALPAQWSAPQFFGALAKATESRIVAPVTNGTQLENLRAAIGDKTLTFKEIAPLYEKALGYRFSNSQFDGDLIKIRLPDETLYPTRPVNESYQPFLDLLLALSPEQIDQMYLQGYLTAQSLTPAQIPLYLKARRKNSISNFLVVDGEPATDAQILAQPLRFQFSFQAAVALPDAQITPIGIFDYGTGLIWSPQVGADTKTLQAATMAAYKAKLAEINQVGRTHTVSDSSEQSRLTTLNFPQTRTVKIGEILDEIEGKLEQKIVFAADLRPQQVRAQSIVISAGSYRADEMLGAIAACAGLQSRFRDDVPTLEKRAPQQPMSQLPPAVEQAQQKLRRLPLGLAGLPFFSSRFEGETVRFDDLTGSEKFYLQARLLNENTVGYDQIDLSKGRVRFANHLYFIASSGGPNSPFITSYVQLR